MATSLNALNTLSSEIRLSICQHTSPPSQVSISEYRGMLLANEFLLYEAVPELVRNMQRYLADIAITWKEAFGSELRITEPSTLQKAGVSTSSMSWGKRRSQRSLKMWPRRTRRNSPSVEKPGALIHLLIDLHRILTRVLHPDICIEQCDCLRQAILRHLQRVFSFSPSRSPISRRNAILISATQAVKSRLNQSPPCHVVISALPCSLSKL